MISEEDAEKSVTYLATSARRAAKARAEYRYLDSFTKVIEAQVMRENKAETVAQAQAIARSDQRYVNHIEAIRTASEACDYEIFMRDAAEAKFAAWQTQSANSRKGVML